MNRLPRLSVFAVFLCAALVYAAQDPVRITASVDKNEIPLDGYLNYRVAISSDVGLDNPKIEFSKLNEDFWVLSSSRNQNFSLSAGKARIEIIFDYVLRPKKEGRFEIEAVKLAYRNKVYKSESLPVKVTPPLNNPPAGVPEEKEDGAPNEKVTF